MSLKSQFSEKEFLLQIGDDKQILKFIKEQGEKLDAKTFYDFLYYAIQKKADDVFSFLCELVITGKLDVNINRDFSTGQNPLSLAVMQNNFDYFKKLILLGANPHKVVGRNILRLSKMLRSLTAVQDHHLMSPLSVMVDLERIDMLKYIQKDVNKKAFIREALRIVDKKDKKAVLDILTEDSIFVMKEILFDAIEKNDAQCIVGLLKLGKITTLNFVNKEGVSPLILAVRKKAYDIMDVFKTWREEKRIIYSIDMPYNGTNPLNEALKLNDLAMVKKLLFMGASPMAKLDVIQTGQNGKETNLSPMHCLMAQVLENKDYDSQALFYLKSVFSEMDLVMHSVHMAKYFGSKKVYNLLFEDKSDLSQVDVFKAKLIEATQKNDIDMVQFLIEHKVSPVENIDNDMALHIASKKGYTDILNIFLKNLTVKKLDTPLLNTTAFETAVWHNQEKAAQQLLMAGADVPIRLKSGEHILMRLVDFDMAKVLKNVLQKNPKFREEKLLQQVLWQAISLSRNKCVRDLLDAKMDINYENYFGVTPLLLAVKKKNYQAAMMLIFQGADIQAFDKKGMNALHYAIQGSHELFSNYLIERGIDIDKQNYLGQTALMLVMERGLKKVVTKLIKSRANALLKDADGKKAIDYYKNFKNKISQKTMERE